MRKKSYQILAGVCAVVLFCSGCRKRVVTGPEEPMSERYHENVPSLVGDTTEIVKSEEAEIHEEKKEQNSSPEEKKNDRSSHQASEQNSKLESKTDSTGTSSPKNNEAESSSEENKKKDSTEKKEKKLTKKNKKNEQNDSEKKSEQDPSQNTEDTPADDVGNHEEDNSKDQGDTPKETPSSEQSPDGIDKEFGIIIDKYKKDFMNQMTIYPCQFLRVYYETKQDYVTVNAGSAEQKLIQDAAAENVGPDLGNEYLAVDFSWVEKKNPEYIIKCVDASVLGEKVEDTDGAKEQWKQISERENWDTLSAVQGGNILLLSEELLESEQGKLMLKYYVANEMKLDEIKKDLLGENGIYCYEG